MTECVRRFDFHPSRPLRPAAGPSLAPAPKMPIRFDAACPRIDSWHRCKPSISRVWFDLRAAFVLEESHLEWCSPTFFSRFSGPSCCCQSLGFSSIVSTKIVSCRVMCQVWNCMEVEYLPVYVPTLEDRDYPRVFASHVQVCATRSCNLLTIRHVCVIMVSSSLSLSMLVCVCMCSASAVENTRDYM